jgi:hypothetical protein
MKKGVCRGGENLFAWSLRVSLKYVYSTFLALSTSPGLDGLSQA